MSSADLTTVVRRSLGAAAAVTLLGGLAACGGGGAAAQDSASGTAASPGSATSPSSALSPSAAPAASASGVATAPSAGAGGGVAAGSGAGAGAGNGAGSGGVGTRMGSFGVAGEVSLSGALTEHQSYTAAACTVSGDARHVAVSLDSGTQIEITVSGTLVASVSVTKGGKTGLGAWSGSAPSVLTLGPESLALRAARVSGELPVVVDAQFAC